MGQILEKGGQLRGARKIEMQSDQLVKTQSTATLYAKLIEKSWNSKHHSRIYMLIEFSGPMYNRIDGFSFDYKRKYRFTECKE